MPSTPRIVFIVHGGLYRKALPDEAFAAFHACFRVSILRTTSPGQAMQLARDAATDGARWVIAVGGDGTVNEVINGLMSLAPAERARVTLGVFPFGSCNDFARSIGVPDSVGCLLPHMAAHHVKALDLIRISYTGFDGKLQQRWCNNMASVGISSDIVYRSKRMPVWLPASLAYYSAAMISLLRFRPRDIRLRLDGQAIAGQFLCVSVANGGYFGCGLGIAPQASLNDGYFELVLIQNAGSLDFLRYLSALRAAQTLDDPRIRYLRGRTLQLDGDATLCPLELDGEPCGTAPARFELVSGALNCLMLPLR